MVKALRQHWPEYLMEAAELGMFMISACVFATLTEHPASPIRQVIANPFLRRMIMSAAMGLTAVGTIFSPWGKRSGAHFNPSVTLAFFRLGKVAAWDAVFYILAQFVGGLSGVALMAVLLGAAVAHPTVNYAVTIPSAAGPGIAFLAEFVISFGLMLVVLIVSNSRRLAPMTGLFAGGLLAIYISFEAPLSGMSMNPARTFGSALLAQVWKALWIYFTAPVLAMLAAAELYVRLPGLNRVICAKLHHHNSQRCIFQHCGYRKPSPAALP